MSRKREPRIVVTIDYLKTRNDTFSLADVQHVRVRRPWLPFAAASAGGIAALTGVFWPELYPLERMVGLSSILLIIAASRIGRLKLESHVLRDHHQGVIWGEIRELRRTKIEVESVLMLRPRAVSSLASRDARGF